MMSIGNTILAAVAALVACSASAQVTWLETSHDFGTFDEDKGKVTCTMRMVNTTSDDVVIISVKPTCGCTAGDYPKNAIAPGDTAVISLTYNPFGRPGKFSKNVIVRTSAEPRVVLTISGNVIGAKNTVSTLYPYEVGDLKLKNMLVPMGKMAKGTVRTATISAYNAGTDSVNISFDNLPKHITAIAYPDCLGPSDIAGITVYYNSIGQKMWGATDETFGIIASDDSGSRIARGEVNVTATVVEDFTKLSSEDMKKAPQLSISNEAIDLGDIDTSQTKPLKYKLQISNIGTNPLLLHRIYSDNPAVDIDKETATIKKGKNITITVTIRPNEITGKVMNSHITLITNDPLRSMANVRVLGLVMH